MKNHLSVVSYPICSAKIPEAFRGFRAAVLSDLHNCMVGEKNELLLEAVRNLRPDVILLTGDMITEEKFGNKVYEDVALALISELAKIAPVYYGMGNHEQRWKERCVPDRRTFTDFCRELEIMGVRIMDNRSVLLTRAGEQIRITGLALPNRYYNKKKRVHLSAEEIRSLVGSRDEEHFQILLAHTPQFYEAYRNWGADVALAGHYHGGVIRIPGLGGLISTNFRLFPKYDHGRYREEGGEMIVTSGLGCHTIPVRLNNPPEVVMLEFMEE